MKQTAQALYEFLNSIPIYDTHEHLAPCQAARERNTDVLREYLRHYMASSVISASSSTRKASRMAAKI